MNPLPPPLPDQSRTDTEHLRVLAICHYVCAGLAVLAMCFAGVHYAAMRMIFCDPRIWEHAKGGAALPHELFGMLKWFYLFGAVVLLAYAVLNLVSARSLIARRRRTLSLVVAGFNCLHLPLGAILGVFTIIVLTRDSVRRSYQE